MSGCRTNLEGQLFSFLYLLSKKVGFIFRNFSFTTNRHAHKVLWFVIEQMCIMCLLPPLGSNIYFFPRLWIVDLDPLVIFSDKVFTWLVVGHYWKFSQWRFWRCHRFFGTWGLWGRLNFLDFGFVGHSEKSYMVQVGVVHVVVILNPIHVLLLVWR